MGFTKLDENILQSSIMAESPETFKVWIAILASCGHDGVARISAVYLSCVCRLDITTVHTALERLQSPDPDSRSTNDDGRRIERIDGGFRVINYMKYREISIQDKWRSDKKRQNSTSEKFLEVPGKDRKECGTPASASSSDSASEKEGYKGGKIDPPAELLPKFDDAPCPPRWKGTPVEPAWIAYLTMRRQIGHPVHNVQVAEVLERHLLTLSQGSVPAIVATLDSATLDKQTRLPTYVAGNVVEAARKAGKDQEPISDRVRRFIAEKGLQPQGRAK